MPKILLEIDDEEDRIVDSVKVIHNLEDKKLAIRKIIRIYGKNIKMEDRNR